VTFVDAVLVAPWFVRHPQRDRVRASRSIAMRRVLHCRCAAVTEGPAVGGDRTVGSLLVLVKLHVSAEQLAVRPAVGGWFGLLTVTLCDTVPVAP